MKIVRNIWKLRLKWIWIGKCLRFWWVNFSNERMNINKKEEGEEGSFYNVGLWVGIKLIFLLNFLV